MLKIGDNLPLFSCQDDKGNTVTQEDFKGKTDFSLPRTRFLRGMLRALVIRDSCGAGDGEQRTSHAIDVAEDHLARQLGCRQGCRKSLASIDPHERLRKRPTCLVQIGRFFDRVQ